MSPLIVLTTTPKDSAKKIAKELVSLRLAACIHIKEIESIYEWKGEIVEDNEVLLIIKTLLDKKDALINKLKSIHPYEVPEIILIDAKADKSYLEWMNNVLN